MVDLERTIDERITPLVDEAMQKYLGVRVEEIRADISDKLRKSPLFDIPIDSGQSFKAAKKAFIKSYIERLLRLHFGNVSEVARISGLDRRSIHRVVQKGKVDVDRFRSALLRSEYVRTLAVKTIIESTLDVYRPIIVPARLDSFVKYVPSLSRDIVRTLPENPVPLAVAEREFEVRYFEQVLASHKGTLGALAKRIGIRYETLHRKLKALGIDRKTEDSIRE